MIAVLFINYNSSNILWLENISILQLKNEKDIIFYLVDNGSNDNSDIELMKLLKTHEVNYRYFRLPYNIGFTRAVNFVFRRLDKDVKYVMLLNNDLVPVRGVIQRLIDVMEEGGYAGVQGTIMQMLRPDLVDNAGHMVDRFGLSYPVCRGHPFSCAQDYSPSYLSGAFSIYRADVIRQLGNPFSDFYDAYLDDKLLGARLRKRGYALFHKAIVAGFHLGSASYGPRRLFKSPTWFKYVALAELAPVAVNAPLPVRLMAYLKYLAAGVLASAIAGGDYLGRWIEVVRLVRGGLPEVDIVRSDFFSLTAFLLQNPVRGIRPPML
jgi:GT2 family glycosyltransferase